MGQKGYTRKQVLKGGAAALLGTSLALPFANREARALSRTVAVGVYPSGNGPLYRDYSGLDAYIDLAGGVQPKIVSVFSPWVSGDGIDLYPGIDTWRLFYDRYTDSVIMWGWEPFGVTLDEINSGAHDAYIDEVARRITAVGSRVLIRFAHEMNGNWSWPWLNQPAAKYIAAWRRIVGRFRSQGATNVEWVWSPNIMYNTDPPSLDFRPYYPGDEYVDWTALDGYNWGAIHTGWRPFREIFHYSIGVISALSPRGIIIAETGCHSLGGPNGVESKGYWFGQMATQLKQNYPAIEGFVYTHVLETRGDAADADWRVDSPAEALDDWRAFVADPQFKAVLRSPSLATRDVPSKDILSPTVLGTSPVARATGVSPSANVSATFSEAMRKDTISATTFKLHRLNADGSKTPVAATVTYDATRKKAVLNPNNRLRRGAKYQATVTTGAKDLAGNPLDQDPSRAGNQSKVWGFRV